VRVGILDQAASVLGRPGQAVLIDCRSLAYTYIPFNLPSVGLLICETGVERSLASSAYNQRRAECEQSVAAFASVVHDEGDGREITALRDVSEVDYLRLAGHVPEPARRRARHVISENGRTLSAVEALKAEDAAAFGRLVLESHASLRDDYAVSCPELDAVVEIATTIPGTLGARLVGAGFGGSALVVARDDELDAVIAALQERYPLRSGLQPAIHRVRAAGGTGIAQVTL
jgi:galactokinase